MALAIASERLGASGAGVLARLAGSLGDSARAAAAELAAHDKRWRLEQAAAARAPIPPGYRAVHPTWIEAILDELPARARTALSGGSTSPIASRGSAAARSTRAASAESIDIWLVRWATADVPPMVTGDRAIDAMLAREPTALVAWLGAIGADQLAFALGPALARSIATLAPAVGRIEKAPRVGQLGPRRAAITRCRDIDPTDELATLRVAGRALAPHLATNQLARLALSRRMPRPLGLVVYGELLAHAATLLDQCPSWRALSAE